ncbi:DUF4396 domain-containing protein [Streptomyces sp. T1317-0309]|nr:DUF4396 domain-containing protein [Streptomyces sp. T1317-0309]
MLVEGVMLLWFIQVVIGVLFVAIDIHTTPEATVMKWGFVIITAFSGLFGALLYVLSCREPLPGTHEQYVSAKWRQVVGSTMHCVAGDGIGILAAKVLTSGAGLPMWADVLCEYGLGFLFGWTVFQALFMKGMFGSYRTSLSKTFIAELLSMNAVMGGMTAHRPRPLDELRSPAAVRTAPQNGPRTTRPRRRPPAVRTTLSRGSAVAGSP